VIEVLATSTRDHVADYVSALFLVYFLIIFAYLLSSMYFSIGGRVPYSRVSNAVLDFLRESSEPYLRIFRRFVPMVGMFDLSPILGLFLLGIVGNIVVSLIRG
jgi:YggT family protein